MKNISKIILCLILSSIIFILAMGIGSVFIPPIQTINIFEEELGRNCLILFFEADLETKFIDNIRYNLINEKILQAWEEFIDELWRKITCTLGCN